MASPPPPSRALERPQAGLPVVCLGDTGGAASDLFQYSLSGALPREGPGPDERDRAYLLEASELLPMIVKEGAEQGGSTKPKLGAPAARDRPPPGPTSPSRAPSPACRVRAHPPATRARSLLPGQLRP